MKTNLEASIIVQMREDDSLDWKMYKQDGEIDVKQVYLGGSTERIYC